MADDGIVLDSRGDLIVAPAGAKITDVVDVLLAQITRVPDPLADDPTADYFLHDHVQVRVPPEDWLSEAVTPSDRAAGYKSGRNPASHERLPGGRPHPVPFQDATPPPTPRSSTILMSDPLPHRLESYQRDMLERSSFAFPMSFVEPRRPDGLLRRLTMRARYAMGMGNSGGLTPDDVKVDDV